MLGVAGAVGDPVGGAVGRVGAVCLADASGENNGAEKGEDDAEDVQHGEDEGLAEAGDDGGHDAVETDKPGQRDDEHGEVDGGAGRGRGIVILGDDVADETGKNDCEDEGDAAQNEVEEARHGGNYWYTC